MTLQEWAKWANATVYFHTEETSVVKSGGAHAFLPYDASLEEVLALYTLSDFIVSSVAGLAIWFVPRNPQNQA